MSIRTNMEHLFAALDTTEDEQACSQLLQLNPSKEEIRKAQKSFPSLQNETVFFFDDLPYQYLLVHFAASKNFAKCLDLLQNLGARLDKKTSLVRFAK